VDAFEGQLSSSNGYSSLEQSFEEEKEEYVIQEGH
jgi:hypothetical protein